MTAAHIAIQNVIGRARFMDASPVFVVAYLIDLPDGSRRNPSGHARRPESPWDFNTISWSMHSPTGRSDRPALRLRAVCDAWQTPGLDPEAEALLGFCIVPEWWFHCKVDRVEMTSKYSADATRRFDPGARRKLRSPASICLRPSMETHDVRQRRKPVRKNERRHREDEGIRRERLFDGPAIGGDSTTPSCSNSPASTMKRPSTTPMSFPA